MPAYRAEATLARTVADIPAGIADHLILVDDASPDNTAALARELGIDVYVHSENRGYGGNQKTCYTEALRQRRRHRGAAPPRLPVRAEGGSAAHRSHPRRGRRHDVRLALRRTRRPARGRNAAPPVRRQPDDDGAREHDARLTLHRDAQRAARVHPPVPPLVPYPPLLRRLRLRLPAAHRRRHLGPARGRGADPDALYGGVLFDRGRQLLALHRGQPWLLRAARDRTRP